MSVPKTGHKLPIAATKNQKSMTVLSRAFAFAASAYPRLHLYSFRECHNRISSFLLDSATHI